MRYSYLKETPWWMVVAISIASIAALLPAMNLIAVGFASLEISPGKAGTLEELGQLGDFFGGHTAAFSGALSLVVILFFTFHQAKQQQQFFTLQKEERKKETDRQFFLEGINLITQWDIASPGCDQCMRLLDYYSRVAVASQEKEQLLLLNTVITASVRKNLEGKNGSFKVGNYPYACEVIELIRPLREADARELKQRRSREKHAE